MLVKTIIKESGEECKEDCLMLHIGYYVNWYCYR